MAVDVSLGKNQSAWHRQTTGDPVFDADYPFTARPTAAINVIWNAIASVLHGNGQLSFFYSRVEIATTGTARVYIHRTGGFSGTVSCDIDTYNTTGNIGMNSTTHFTAVSETVTFAAGEVGLKYIDITVGTSPGAGLHMFGVEMTNATGGATIRHPRMHVYFDDGLVNTGATSVTASTAVSAVSVANPSQLTVADSSVFINGQQSVLAGFTTTPDINGLQTVTIVNSTTISIPVNVTVVTDGIGTITDAVLETTINTASAGDLIYMRSTGGDYTYNRRTSPENIGGVTIKNSGTKTAPLIIANYPGETPKIDQNYYYPHDRSGYDITTGIYIADTSSYLHIKGIEVTRTLASGIMTDNSITDDVVIEDCNVHEIGKSNNYSATSDNLGAVALGFSTNGIIRNNQLNSVYQYVLGGGGSNPINAEPYPLHSGIHGYQMKNLWVHNNHIHTCARAVYGKHPRQETGGATFHHIHHNFFDLVGQECILFQVAGSGAEPGHDILIHDNVGDMSVTSSVDTAFVSIAYANDIITQADGLWIFNNTLIDGFYLYVCDAIEGIVAYNNIAQDSNHDLKILADSVRTFNNQIEYNDYNCWNNITSTNFITGEGGSPYTTLASWQTAFSVSSDPQLDRDPDNNSITTAPTFVNQAGDDFRTTSGVTVGTGRFGRDIGIGSELVGVQ